MAKRAIVVNGNKNYPKATVFAIRGCRIVKSWSADYYLRTSLRVLKSQILPERVSSQRYVK